MNNKKYKIHNEVQLKDENKRANNKNNKYKKKIKYIIKQTNIKKIK